MNVYYVYAYLRSKDNTPYYIGKGKDDRAYEDHRILNDDGRIKGVHTPKDKSRIVFLETNLTEIGALALEQRMIRWYGRKDLGEGMLLNKTNGGDGTSGYRHTEESRAKMSAARKGKPLSEEHRASLSAVSKGKPSPKKGILNPGVSAALKGVAKPKLTCPHCGKTGGVNIMSRWHFDNCKGKNQ